MMTSHSGASSYVRVFLVLSFILTSVVIAAMGSVSLQSRHPFFNVYYSCPEYNVTYGVGMRIALYIVLHVNDNYFVLMYEVGFRQ